MDKFAFRVNFRHVCMSSPTGLIPLFTPICWPIGICGSGGFVRHRFRPAEVMKQTGWKQVQLSSCHRTVSQFHTADFQTIQTWILMMLQFVGIRSSVPSQHMLSQKAFLLLLSFKKKNKKTQMSNSQHQLHCSSDKLHSCTLKWMQTCGKVCAVFPHWTLNNWQMGKINSVAPHFFWITVNWYV